MKNVMRRNVKSVLVILMAVMMVIVFMPSNVNAATKHAKPGKTTITIDWITDGDIQGWNMNSSAYFWTLYFKTAHASKLNLKVWKGEYPYDEMELNETVTLNKNNLSYSEFGDEINSVDDIAYLYPDISESYVGEEGWRKVKVQAYGYNKYGKGKSTTFTFYVKDPVEYVDSDANDDEYNDTDDSYDTDEDYDSNDNYDDDDNSDDDSAWIEFFFGNN